MGGLLGAAERRVFVGLSSKTVTEEELRHLLERFGEVEEAYVMKAKGGVSKGCAMARFKTRAAGQAAIDALHEKYTFEGAEQPISIKWADPPPKAPGQAQAGAGALAGQPALSQQQQMLLQQGILLGQQMAAQQLHQQQQQQQMQQQLRQQMQHSFAAQPQWGHAAAVAPAPPQTRPVAPKFAFGATAQPTYAGFSSAVPEEEAYDYYAQAY